jgi:hypothetical protein
MPKIIARLGAAAVALTAVGAVAVSTGVARAHSQQPQAIPAVCYDGFALWRYYNSIGDSATASGLLSNLIGMGCFDDLPEILNAT